MRNNKINLTELLKGCEEEEFYSRCFGPLKFINIREDNILIFRKKNSEVILYPFNGKYDTYGEVDLFPSKELYEKYPLDAYTAWMEWKFKRQRYIIKVNFVSEYIDSDGDKSSEGIIDEIRFSSKAKMDKAFNELWQRINTIKTKEKGS